MVDTEMSYDTKRVFTLEIILEEYSYYLETSKVTADLC